MSDVAVLSDVSMTELRVISLVGLLVTAVIATGLAMLFASGGAALGRLVRHALDRHRRTSSGTTGSGSSRPRSDELVSNGHRELRARQAAWRLRL